MNNITIIGNLTRDPEIKTDSTGKEMCCFTIADNRMEANGNKVADYFNCIAYGNVCTNISRYFRKGDYIGVRGKVRISSYQTKHGDHATATRIFVDEFSFCGSGYEETKNNSNQTADAEVDISIGNEDDLPF